MKQIFFVIALIVFISVSTNKGYAAEKVSRPSASLTGYEQSRALNDVRIQALRNVLSKYNSPIADKAAAFVRYADAYGVDWKLLPAISGLESTFGNHLISGSHNAYGWGGGLIYFNSWEDGIRTINQALRKNYINRGATDVWSIGPIYAASPTWSVRVNHFMNEIDQEYLRLTTFSILPNI